MGQGPDLCIISAFERRGRSCLAVLRVPGVGRSGQARRGGPAAARPPRFCTRTRNESGHDSEVHGIGNRRAVLRHACARPGAGRRVGGGRPGEVGPLRRLPRPRRQQREPAVAEPRRAERPLHRAAASGLQERGAVGSPDDAAGHDAQRRGHAEPRRLLRGAGARTEDGGRCDPAGKGPSALSRRRPGKRCRSLQRLPWPDGTRQPRRGLPHAARPVRPVRREAAPGLRERPAQIRPADAHDARDRRAPVRGRHRRPGILRAGPQVARIRDGPMQRLLAASFILMLALAGCGEPEPPAPVAEPESVAEEAAPEAPAAPEEDATADETPTQVLEESATMPEEPPGNEPIKLARANVGEPQREWRFREGVHFERLVPTQPTIGGPDKIEVAEVFWYGCPHCRDFEPIINAWAERAPANVRFVRIPAAWNPLMKLHAQLYYTEQELVAKGAIANPESFRAAVFRE